MGRISDSRYVVTAGWDDVPHLDPTTQKELIDSFAPHLRDARTKGIPSLGVGAIYPVPFEAFACEPFGIPDYWPRAYALDVGWKRTAAVWGAWNPSDGVCYLYSEHYRGEAKPIDHAQAIKARGEWVRGVIDPAARGRGQDDGRQLLAQYQSAGLDLTVADNAVEAGIYDVWTDLATQQLRVFTTLSNWRSEFERYHRDEKGRIVKADDHLMDCTRYLRRSGRAVARVRPVTGSAAPTPYGVADRRAGY